jgi:hypothetical protein
MSIKTRLDRLEVRIKHDPQPWAAFEVKAFIEDLINGVEANTGKPLPHTAEDAWQRGYACMADALAELTGQTLEELIEAMQA